MKKIVPELMVNDILESVKFYEEVLGFSEMMRAPEAGPVVWMSLKNGEAEIMLYLRSAFEEEIGEMKGRNLGGGAALYIGVDNIEELYEKVKTRAKVVKELHETTYGSKEFALLDNSGYVVILTE